MASPQEGPYVYEVNEPLENIEQSSGHTFNFTDNKLSILILGNTGVGKSTLVNSFFGTKVAIVSHGADSTAHEETIMKYRITIANIEVTIYDTRGLADSRQSDADTVRQLKSKCKEVDIVFFCVELISRMEERCFRTVKVLANAFDKKIWEKCILVLTKANIVKETWDEDDTGKLESMMLEKMHEYCVKFHSCLQEQNTVDDKVALAIPVCLAGNSKNIQIPICSNWITYLLHVCYLRCAVNRRAAVEAIANERVGIMQWINRQIIWTLSKIMDYHLRIKQD